MAQHYINNDGETFEVIPLCFGLRNNTQTMLYNAEYKELPDGEYNYDLIE